MTLKWNSKFELKPNTWIFVPSDETIETGKKIKNKIEKRWRPPSNYFHLQNGGHVSGLKVHLQNSYFVRLDIEDFFGSINKSKIIRCLKDLLSYKDARDIAIHSTVIHPNNNKWILPFGFVQSPIIASVCLYKSALGKYLDELSHNADVIVSVYVDDILLSSNDLEALKNYLKMIQIHANRSKFILNPKKQDGPSPKITAFNIDLSKLSLEVSVERWKGFLTMFKESTNEHTRQGILSYINSVNPAQAKSLEID